jgi:hypothetical protein
MKIMVLSRELARDELFRNQRLKKRRSGGGQETDIFKSMVLSLFTTAVSGLQLGMKLNTRLN